MKARIDRVIVFKKNYKKNEVIFTEGLNIITGNSQTGKSAILEIIDYCLLNSIDSIPRGIITENVILYCIILELKDKKLILARKAFKDEGILRGKDQIFYNFVNLDFDDEKLNYGYFELKKELYRPIKDVKVMLLYELGIDIIKKIDLDEENKHRVSIRNIVSYMFQQQNLIANKYALFYRFEDSFKRKNTIEEFPVLTGIINQNYYQDLKKIEELKKEEKKLKKEISDLNNELLENETKLKDLKKELNVLIFDKKRSFDIEEDNINHEAIKKENEKILKKINELSNELYEINAQKVNLIYTKENKIGINGVLKERTAPEFNTVTECPICKSKLEEFNQEIKYLNEKKKELISVFTMDNNSYSDIDEKIKRYEVQEKELENEITKLRNKNKTNINILKAKNNREIMNIIVKKEMEVSQLEKSLNSNLGKELNERWNSLSNRISFIENKILEYDVENKMKEAEVEIGKLMSKLAKAFGFEIGLGEPDFKIDLKEFDVYQRFNKEKIFISSMGSGSNWLTVHLSLFLALNYYICMLGENCAIPTILLLDQPSQVYFPDIFNENSEDVIKVTNIYSVILKYVNYTEKKTGIKPQIIIVDHADKLNLGEGISFDSFVRARWKKENEGFITID